MCMQVKAIFLKVDTHTQFSKIPNYVIIKTQINKKKTEAIYDWGTINLTALAKPKLMMLSQCHDVAVSNAYLQIHI